MMSKFRDVLSEIPASLPYGDWIRVAAALKNEGEKFETFDQWSSTCAEKYDADAAREAWDSVGGPEHPEITEKTLHYLRTYYNKFTPAPQDMLPPPESDEELYAQREMLLSMLFPQDKALEVIVTKAGTEKTPARPGILAPWPQALKRLQEQTVDNGAWFVINDLNLPLKGSAASDQDIKDYRYALVEADEGTREEQWQAMISLPVIPPIQAAIWSGGKSIHYIVRIDASDLEQYRKRIRQLYDYLQHQGIKIDSSNKNPSRPARLPGIKRGEDKQYFLAKSFGAEDWAVFEERLEADKKPDRRAVTSPINGQKGGGPPFDTRAYADLYVRELEKQDKKLIFWHRNFYFYGQNRWILMPVDELEPRLSAFLQEHCPGKSRIGKSMVTDLEVCLKKNHVSNSDCPEAPFLIREKKHIPDCMIFANVAVRLEDLKSTPLTECPVISKDSNLFGEDDVTYRFAPEAQCPRWERAVAQWFPEEAERKMFQKIFGYIISRSTALNVCFFWYGEAGTGKSTALKVLRALMGERRCSAVPIQSLCGRFNTGRFTTSYLNTQEELPTDARTRGQDNVESLLKTATDGGTIQIEKKGIDPVDGNIKARFIFCTNTLPRFNDSSDGIWERIVIQEFRKKIRFTDVQQRDYAAELLEELPGIFNWAVQGMKDLQGDKTFPSTPRSAEILDTLRKQCNLEDQFVREKFTVAPGNAISFYAVMNAYKEYATTYRGTVKTQDAVKAALKRMFSVVEFKRSRLLGQHQPPAVFNLKMNIEDEWDISPSPPYQSLHQGGSCPDSHREEAKDSMSHYAHSNPEVVQTELF